MPEPARRPLYYTFGNHMHWVDMQWLWGYGVLPGSVRDMLRLIDETGARGNVNFDGVGYEKMAAEAPEALAELRAAVLAGKVEPVGCSYGQPYGLFQGGESNVRQLTYGTRTVRRLLGVRPRGFWEEEFYFFPQLPQMLAGTGFTGACLFFQWTWHTPEVPREPSSLILWEGIDGTRLPALPRNDLNVHQWPEEFDGLLDGVGRLSEPTVAGADRLSEPTQSARRADLPAIVQWLELLPTRDWMCRSEILLPRLKELMADPRFEVRARTLSGLIDDLAEAAGIGRSPAEPPPPGRSGVEPAHGSPPPGPLPQGGGVRGYTMDDVWHGVSLGKNGDAHPRASRLCEKTLTAAESAAALLSLFGRPYANWDVYPTWELEEGWRELLAAQHHDNHECEGLCGFIGDASFRRAAQLAEQVGTRVIEKLAERVDAPAGSVVLYNPVGVARDLYLTMEGDVPPKVVRGVPPFGYAVVRPESPIGRTAARGERIEVRNDRNAIVMTRGGMQVAIDKRRGVVRQIVTPEFPQGVLHPERALGELSMVHGDGPDTFERAEVQMDEVGGVPVVQVLRYARDGSVLGMSVKLTALTDALDISFIAEEVPRSEARMHAGLQTAISPSFDIGEIVADHPYGVSRVRADGTFRRKYPTGDWMTSRQVFEEIRRPFTGLSFVDLLESPGGRGLLCTHDGSQQFFREETGIRSLLTMYDAWDEENYNPSLRASLTFLPHGPMTDAERAMAAGIVGGGWNLSLRDGDPGDIPAQFGCLSVEGAPGVLATAFHRESMKSGEHLPEWAGHRMFRDSGGACDHPFVVRLVEWNGQPAEVTLKLPGRIGLAAKTNLLGEVGPAVGGGADTAWLDVEENVEPPHWARMAAFRGEALPWTALRFRMRPREIATVMADLVMGRKEWRDLDSQRAIWAKVHKEGA